MTTAPTTTPTTTAVIAIRLIPCGSGYGAPLAPAIYRPVATREGRWIWRCVERCLLGTLTGRDGKPREKGVYSVKKAERLAAELAAARGLTEWGAAHNRELTPAEMARFVTA